jgi:hypothetical protein
MKKTQISMHNIGRKHVLAACGIVVGTVSLSYVAAPLFSWEYNPNTQVADAGTGVKDVIEPEPEVARASHIDTPEMVKALYMTACYAATPSLREGLIEKIERTEANSIVIDIKDYSGTIAFETEDERFHDATEHAGGCIISDLPGILTNLHERGIYTIARITVFQDPYYASRHPDIAVQKASDRSAWKDYKGISFVDAGAMAYHDYIIALAKEAYAIGFDEINFDYVRFPSDGNMQDIWYPISEETVTADPLLGKARVVESFFTHLSQELRDESWLVGDEKGPKLSADLFGMTATNTDDLNIGQILEYAAPYFDYIAPMVYPSHYPTNFHGYSDVNAHAYDIVAFSMATAVARMKAAGEDIQKLRPWLQDFDYPVPYTPDMVREQIHATYDTGLTSWMLWDPTNTYTEPVLESEARTYVPSPYTVEWIVPGAATTTEEAAGGAE